MLFTRHPPRQNNLASKRSFGVLLTVLLMVFLPFIGTGAMGADEGPPTLPSASSGRYYYLDSSSGSNTNNGTSPSSAWATIAKMNNQVLRPGDTVLLKRGCVFNTSSSLFVMNSGNSTHPITIGAYGSGAKPVINLGGSSASGVYITSSYVIIKDIVVRNAGKQGFVMENVNTPTHHIQIIDCEAYNIGGNGILHTFGGSDITVKRFRLNNTGNSGIALIGSSSNHLSNVLVEDCWISNATSNDGITIHEGANSQVVVGSNITLKGNHVQYCQEDGYDITSGNDIWLINNTSTKNVKTSIQFGHTAYDVKVIGHHSWDEGTHRTSGASISLWISDVLVRDSIFEGGNYHTFHFCDPYGDNIDNVTFENNFIGWGGSRDIVFLEDKITNLTFRNNIFYSNYTSGRQIQFNDRNQGPDSSSLAFRNNIYYSRGTFNFNDIDDGLFNLSVFKSTYGQDPNGTDENPDLVDYDNSDFRLEWTSPAIDAGVDTDSSVDILHNPIYGIRDIGPYEYQPPYSMGKDSIQADGSVRLYSDGKFRYLSRGTSSRTASLEIRPYNGYRTHGANEKRSALMDVDIDRWDTSGNLTMDFTVDHLGSDRNYRYILGSLPSNTSFRVTINNRSVGVSRTDANGTLVVVHNSSSARDHFLIERSGSFITIIDTSPTSATTGDALPFSFNIKDTDGISGAWLRYRYQGSSTYLNISLSRTSGTARDGTWRTSINVSSSSDSDILYMTGARNVSGTVSWTQETIIEVVDDDPPAIISYSCPSSVGTGNTFTVSLTGTDNIGVSSSSLLISTDGNSTFSSLSDDTQPFNFTLKAPDHSIDDLVLNLSILDGEGNADWTGYLSVAVFDDDPPELVNDSTPDEGTTGDVLGFTFEVRDNMAVNSTVLEYWYGSGSHSTTALSGSGTYRGNLTLPPNSVQTLHYRVMITDDASNRFNSSVRNVTVIDDDGPVLERDLTPRTAGTGNTFTFSFAVNDNIGIGTSSVEYWFGTSGSTNLSLVPGPYYNATITIPKDDLSVLNYRLHLKDAAGNTYTGSTGRVTVIDDDLPELIRDLTPRTATTGENVTIHVELRDNMGLDIVNIEHWSASGPRTNQTVEDSGDGIYTLTLMIPETFAGTISYRVIAADTSGNDLVSPVQEIDVLDNDLPRFLEDRADDECYTGDQFTFRVVADDNIGISNVSVVYAYGGEGFVIPLLGETVWTGSIVVDTSAEGEMIYHYVIRDLAGNVRNSDEFAVPVLDNDPPYMIDDMTDEMGWTGSELHFRMDAGDNIGIGNVSVNTEFLSLREVLLLTESGGLFTGSILLPGDMTGELRYEVTIIDTSGNSVTSEPRWVSVADGIPPSFMNFGIDGEMTTGERARFWVEVADNTGVGSVRLHYNFSGLSGSQAMIDGGEGLFSIDLDVPLNSSGPMSYRFEAVDDWGNMNLSDIGSGDVRDNDPPEFDESNQKYLISRGAIDITSYVVDNTRVDRVILIYSFDGGEERMIELSSDGHFYNYSLEIPEGGFETLVYRTVAYDTYGNSNEVSEVELVGIFFSEEAAAEVPEKEQPRVTVQIQLPDSPPLFTGKSHIAFSVSGEGVLLSSALFIDGRVYSVLENNVDLALDGPVEDQFMFLSNDMSDGRHSIQVKCYFDGGGFVSSSIREIDVRTIPESLFIDKLLVDPATCSIFVDEYVVFRITLVDENGDLIDNELAGVTWTQDNMIGTLDGELRFVPFRAGECNITFRVSMNGRSENTTVHVIVRELQDDSGVSERNSSSATIYPVVAVIAIGGLLVLVLSRRREDEPLEVEEVSVIDDEDAAVAVPVPEEEEEYDALFDEDEACEEEIDELMSLIDSLDEDITEE